MGGEYILWRQEFKPSQFYQRKRQKAKMKVTFGAWSSEILSKAERSRDCVIVIARVVLSI